MKALSRGTLVYQEGYPYIVLQRTKARPGVLVPCTTIIAYGDKDAEQQYRIDIPYEQLTIKSL